MTRRLLAALALAGCAALAAAQDTGRGRKLFVDTAGATGKPVGNCVTCHADAGALRAMIENRRGHPVDARAIRKALHGAIEGSAPGARNAKAQYRGVLTDRDLDDVSAYIAHARAT